MLQIEVRNEGRSISARLLQLAFRYAKSAITTSQPEHPAGSPRLEITAAASQKCLVTERNVDDTWLYDLVPKDDTIAEQAKRRRIY